MFVKNPGALNRLEKSYGIEGEPVAVWKTALRIISGGRASSSLETIIEQRMQQLQDGLSEPRIG
jgi:hypothetical protein